MVSFEEEVIALENEIFVNKLMIKRYTESMIDDYDYFPALEKVYKEIGVMLPEQVLKRLEDVRVFQESIAENRRSILEEGIAELEEEVREGEERLAALKNSTSSLNALSHPLQ